MPQNVLISVWKQRAACSGVTTQLTMNVLHIARARDSKTLLNTVSLETDLVMKQDVICQVNKEPFLFYSVRVKQYPMPC